MQTGQFSILYLSVCISVLFNRWLIEGCLESIVIARKLFFKRFEALICITLIVYLYVFIVYLYSFYCVFVYFLLCICELMRAALSPWHPPVQTGQLSETDAPPQPQPIVLAQLWPDCFGPIKDHFLDIQLDCISPSLST